jgi:nucleoid-associated protein YgaU
MPTYEFPGHDKARPPGPAQIQSELQRLGLPAGQLHVEALEDGALRLSGAVPDPDAHERILVAIANMPGVARVEDRVRNTHGSSLLDSLGSFAHLPPGAAATEMAEDMVHEADPSRVHADPLGPAGSSLHTVQPGETLDSIAQRHYGDRDMMLRILDANRFILHGPGGLRPGMVLRVPRR